MGNTRFLEAQKARFRKSIEPVAKKRAKAVERFTQIAKDFKAEIQYYDQQITSIEAAIRALEVPIEEQLVRDELNDTTLTQHELIVDENTSTSEEQVAEVLQPTANNTPVWAATNGTDVGAYPATVETSENRNAEFPDYVRDENV